ncbi:MAG TPA: choice-of-anchor E domain-containing protein [Flavitalea sp.]|nr:choice-of-anchor E domain-containing protein [Flavitalea sp.]
MKKTVPYFLWIPLSCLFLVCTQAGFSQCPANYTLQSIRHDAVAIGNGNGTFNFNFPQFNPALGTLIGAEIIDSTRLQYTFSLYHATYTGFYQTNVVRTDEITGSAISPPGSVLTLDKDPKYNLFVPANTTVTRGPVTYNYVRKYMVNDGRLSNFMGGGTVTLGLENTSMMTIGGPVNYTLKFLSAIDSIWFSVVYTYCQQIIMPAKLEQFEARRKTPAVVVCDFTPQETTRGIKYTLESSIDGNNFTPVPATLSVTGNRYSFAYGQAPQSKLYLRIRSLSPNGTQGLSLVRTVAANDESLSTEIKIYPNPVRDHFTLVVPGEQRGNWSVRILSAAGNKMSEQTFSNTSVMEISIPPAFRNGLYFVETLNRETGKRTTSRLSVQR